MDMEYTQFEDTTQSDYKWTIDGAAMCFIKDIKQCLPSIIFDKIDALYGQHKNSDMFHVIKHKYNAIFKCGGIKTDGLNSNYSNCMILAENGI